ncbi:hypothetical protein E4U41_005649 [Claviceps citrina]|nr:hypothetical protein E4U41_005649 [Claviceps citrina]
MASFFPLISEILPMIMPATAHVARAKDIESERPPAEGPVTVRPAIVGKSDKMSSTDAILYVVSGSGTLTVNEGFEAELRKHDIGAGDFAFVPAWTEHQVSNPQAVDLVCVVIHGGPRPVGATLSDWGGDEVTSGG